MTEVHRLAVAKIHPDPNNPRRDLGDLTELAASIKAVGQLQPILVREDPDRAGHYRLIAGHRRHAAHSLIKRKTIDALIDDTKGGLEDADAIARMLVENLQRDDLDPVEEAAGYRSLADAGWKQRDIARTVGVSPGTVSKRLKILELDDRILSHVRRGNLAVDTAYETARALSDPNVDTPALEAWLEEVIDSVETPGSSWRGQILESTIHQGVNQQLNEAKLEAQRQALVDELRQAGHRELEPIQRQTGRRIEGWGALDVDYDAHLPLECGAYDLVRRRTADGEEWTPEFWCTAPFRHFPDGDSDVKVVEASVDAEKARAKGISNQAQRDRDLAERSQARLAAYRKAVRTPTKDLPIDAATIYRHLTEILLQQYSSGAIVDKAAEILDLDGYRPSHPHRDRIEVVSRAIAADPIAGALALALAQGDFILAAAGDSSTFIGDFRVRFAATLGYAGIQGSLVEEEEADG